MADLIALLGLVLLLFLVLQQERRKVRQRREEMRQLEDLVRTSRREFEILDRMGRTRGFEESRKRSPESRQVRS